MTMHSDCDFCAMVDIATDEVDGMCGIEDLPTAKVILSRIARRVPIKDVILRIEASAFASELIAYLPHIYGHTVEALEPVGRVIKLVDWQDLDDEELYVFADIYWSLKIRQYIASRDYRRAFDAMKEALRGFDPEPVHETWVVPEHGGTEHLAISLRTLRLLVNELYTIMNEAELLEDIPAIPESQITFAPGSCPSEPAGILFAHAIGGHSLRTMGPTQPFRSESRFTTCGLQVIAIAKYFNKLHKEAKKRRRERELACSST